MQIAELAGKRSIVMAAAVTAGLCASTWPHADAQQPRQLAQKPIGKCADRVKPTHTPAHAVAIETTRGTLHCALFPEAAPRTVANFVGLATGEQGWTDPYSGRTKHIPFYDGLTFHRVIPGFVIQGGDPLGNGTGGPGYELADELGADLAIHPGVLAMANKGPNTNGSQFFITDGSPNHLRGHYTVFGECVDLDVVKRIASVPRDSMDKPLSPVTILHVTVQ
jgi:peptidyl-prolyl cis-trans isomerase A (cyclophilin A)